MSLPELSSVFLKFRMWNLLDKSQCTNQVGKGTKQNYLFQHFFQHLSLTTSLEKCKLKAKIIYLFVKSSAWLLFNVFMYFHFLLSSLPLKGIFQQEQVNVYNCK